MNITKKHTYCPRLWNEIYIEQDGKVYTCCHRKPSVLGNIYEEKLSDIFNNARLIEFRKKSMNGKLNCFKHCTLLEKENIEFEKREPETDYSSLKRLKIQFGEACNIDCIMCWQDRDNKELLNFDRFIGNVDMSPFEDIEIQGGEPLFMKDAKSFFDYAADKGHKISFLTNGLPITEKWAEKIALHSSFVNFSMNAATKETHEHVNKGSRWEIVLKNIARVRKYRDELSTGLKIKGHMTLITYNIKEIPQFIENFDGFGLDSIEFGYDYKLPFYLKLHPIVSSRLKSRIREALEKSPHRNRVDTHRLRLLKLVE